MIENRVHYKYGVGLNTTHISSHICFSDFTRNYNQDFGKSLIYVFNPYPDFTKEEVIKVVKSFRGLNIKLKWVKYPKFGDDLYPLVAIPDSNSLGLIKYVYYVLRYFHETKGSVVSLRKAFELKQEFKSMHISIILMYVAALDGNTGHPISSKGYISYSNVPKNYKEVISLYGDKGFIPWFQIGKDVNESNLKEKLKKHR